MNKREDESDGTASFSIDAVYKLLAHERRRILLDRLYEHEVLTLPDLADEIACTERDEPITEIPEEEVLRVYSSLWHRHVPKLADADVVEYEQDRDLVSLGENAERIEPFVACSAAEGVEADDADGGFGDAERGRDDANFTA